MTLYASNLKNRDFDQEAPLDFCLERMAIAGRQGMSEDENSGVKPTESKTDFSGCLCIPALTIFFPFFNDEQTVDLLIEQAYFFGSSITKNLEVIAIHGGNSKDNTFEAILNAKIKHPDLIILDHSCNREGYGVIRHGLQAATKEWVFYTDGDGQYNLRDLQKLIDKALELGSDVVNGFKLHRSDPWYRILLGKGYQVFSRLLFQLPIRDVDCDFRLIRKKYLMDIQFISSGSSILPELILNLQQAGAKFSEVPVQHYPRIYGHSNYTPFKLFSEKFIGDLKLCIHWKQKSSSEEVIFQAMRLIEEKFWWYVSLRESIYFEIKKISGNPLICDVGCGTGCLMQFLQEKNFTVQGIDKSAVGLKYCFDRGLTQVQQGSIVMLPAPEDSFDIVLVIDVLCMLEDVEKIPAIQELNRILKPGGALILNEPAFNWIRSQHDLSCRIKRRFNKQECISLLMDHGFEIKQASYRVCFLFPFIAVIKLIKKFTFKPHAKSDLKMPFKPINWLLKAVQRLENRLIKRGYKLPFGSSLFLVARKK